MHAFLPYISLIISAGAIVFALGAWRTRTEVNKEAVEELHEAIHDLTETVTNLRITVAALNVEVLNLKTQARKA